MFELNDFIESQNRLKQSHGEIFGNCFLMRSELENLAEEEGTELIVKKNGIFILKKEEEFFRMYFYVPQKEVSITVHKFLENFYSGFPVVFDLIGRARSVQMMGDNIGNENITVYAKYSRYILTKRRTPKKFYRNICMDDKITFGYAKEEDVDQVLLIILESFDKYTSHVPFTRSKLMEHIKKKEICCVYYRENVTAVFCFERLDQKNVHLNVVAAAKEYDSLGLGIVLYEYVLDLFLESTTFICWIEENNKASISMHTAFGFEQDHKMLFYLFVYDKKRELGGGE